MLPVVGYLVTLLALARFFAPVPSDADAAVPTPVESTLEGGRESANPPALRKLREVVFLPGLTDGNRAAPDLRNPFEASKPRAGSGAQPRVTTTPAKTARDLRDPFATKPGRPQRRDAAPDLRDPFVEPRRTLPKCPDTGGVPIQRPDSIDPGCATASLRVVLANR